MTNQRREADEVRALDIEVGENDMPGIAIDLTTDDIDDIAFDPGVSADERRSRLMRLRDELSVRQSADFMGDMGELLDHVRDRLGSLMGNPIEGDAELAATAMDADARSDDDDPADHVDDEDEDERIADLSSKAP
jgi:hypothetical protein